MKNVEDWLTEYGESHQHPVNILIHKICVPSIVFSILGMLWNVPLPLSQSIFNAATLVIIGSLIFYFSLSTKLGIGIVLMSTVFSIIIVWLNNTLPIPLWQFSLAVFIIAWIFQFIGHKIEGKKPSFFKDLLFLLIGPLWTINFIYKKIGISI